MKYLILSTLVCISVFFISCEDESTVPNDEANRFYAEYQQIYTQADSVGPEKTLEALDIYLLDYPEQTQAHVYRAYLLANMGKQTEADKSFKTAYEMDKTHLDTYIYWTAFLLRDPARMEEAKQLIGEGMAVKDSSALLNNNLTWYHLLTGNHEEALSNSTFVLKLDKKNLNYYRSMAIAQFANEQVDSANHYIDIAKSMGLQDTDGFESYLNSELTLEEYYTQLKME